MSNVDIMSLLEPITYENINELEPGEWIWDNKLIDRRFHDKNLWNKTVAEPIGFRLLHILDLKHFPRFSSKPFLLSTFDHYGFDYTWEYFEEGRFYRFKRKGE